MRIKVAQLLLLIFLFRSNLIAQSCDCHTNFDSLSANIERNYAGYVDKVMGVNESAYIKFKDSLSRQASITNGYKCYLLLRSYTNYFKDPHLYVTITGALPNSPYIDSLRTIFKTFESKPVNLKNLHRYYDKGSIDNIEGIWQALDYRFSIAIYRDPTSNSSRFLGVTLQGDSIKWFPGQIKMEIKSCDSKYQVKYFKGDHLPDTVLISPKKGLMDLGIYGRWRRIYPANSTLPDLPEQPSTYTKISPSSSILKINDARISSKKMVDSIVGANIATIHSTPYLIIDLRNNPGGFSMTFDTLLPLIYSRPIVRDGLFLRASNDNIEMYKELLANTNFSTNDLKEYKAMIDIMESAPNKMVKVSSGDTITYKTRLPYPRKVAIIVNKKTASASELFILLAKQSDKVSVIGPGTKGQLDYSEIGHERRLPCPYLQFYCPMGKGEHLIFPYIDNIGITPDVIIPDNEIKIESIQSLLDKNN